MFKDESFDEFYTKINDIVNSAYNLGEIYDQPKIVRKILRSLTEDLRSLIEDFRPKVTAITESKDVDDNGFDDELSFTKIAYLAKNFKNFLKNKNRRARGRNNVEPKNFKQNEPTKINNVEKKKLVNLLVIL